MPPKKTEDITSILERKFDELKEVFFKDVRVNLLEEFKCIMKDEMKGFVESQNKKGSGIRIFSCYPSGAC